jgi:hypothetical protein
MPACGTPPARPSKAVRVASKPANPIECHLFPHVARACQGMLFDTLETVIRLMRKAATTTGLRTTVHVIHRAYEIGRTVADHFKATMRLRFEDLLPTWNYVAVPQ